MILGLKMTTYAVLGMDCADCAMKVERGISRLPGAGEVRVDFITGKLEISGSVPSDAIRERLNALGYGLAEPAASVEKPAEPGGASPQAEAGPGSAGGVIGFGRYLLREKETRLALGGALLIGSALIGALIGLPALLTQALLIVAIAIAAFPALRKGLNALRINREFSIDLLMVSAAVGAVLVGDPLEGAAVVVLYAIGEALEGYSVDRARSSLRGLMALRPLRAMRLTDGVPHEVAADDLRVGDRVLIRPGEQVPADCVLVAGTGEINQAAITGESLPVLRHPGDSLLAGSLNGSVALEASVERPASDSTLSRIIHLVEQAQSERAPSQRLIEQIARVYTPFVLFAALAIALIPPLFGGPFWNTPTEQGWFYRALSLLVIACPCALLISAPVTMLSAITAAARRGVLIKGGAHLEALAQVRTVAFDKTGTLTQGRLAIQAIQAADCPQDVATSENHHHVTECGQCADVLALAAAVEQGSTHPLARAVVAEAQAHGMTGRYTASEVQALPGQGVQGLVNGQRVTIGSHAFFDAQFPHSAALHAQVQALEASGQMALLVHDANAVRGYLSASDAIREGSASVVAELHGLNLRTVMLSGDQPAAAQRIAEAAGITEVYAGLMPAAKLERIHALNAQQGPVAMVGDGINDTPALAAASVGIAMGGAGSAQAVETADLVLMADGLTALPFAIRLARFTRRLIAQNVGISIVTKLLFVALAIEGSGSLWLAIAADMGVSFVVTLNGMRALRTQG